MPIGELIGAAIGIMLLIIVAYVVVGSVLVTSEISISAQRDIAIQNEIKANTRLEIPSYGKSLGTGTPVTFFITNTGNEIIPNFTHMDIVANTNCTLSGYPPVLSAPVLYNYNTPNGWYINNPPGILIDDDSYPPNSKPDIIHHGMLDPGERMEVSFYVPSCNSGYALESVYVTVISGNGATVSTTIS
jgi:flagellar protein FlaF